MSAPTIILVEDDPALRTLTARALQENGYLVRPAGTAPEMWIAFDAGPVDLVLLDIMLPGTSGIDLCRQIRQKSEVPIIFVSAKNSETDRVIGLELGADDYIAKPFGTRELIARVRAVLRRRAETLPQPSEAKIYRFEGFIADPQARRVTDPHGGDVELTGAEFDLLRTFLERPGRVSRDQLLDLTRGRDGDVLDRMRDARTEAAGGDAPAYAVLRLTFRRR